MGAGIVLMMVVAVGGYEGDVAVILVVPWLRTEVLM